MFNIALWLYQYVKLGKHKCEQINYESAVINEYCKHINFITDIVLLVTNCKSEYKRNEFTMIKY